MKDQKVSRIIIERQYKEAPGIDVEWHTSGAQDLYPVQGILSESRYLSLSKINLAAWKVTFETPRTEKYNLLAAQFGTAQAVEILDALDQLDD